MYFTHVPLLPAERDLDSGRRGLGRPACLCHVPVRAGPPPRGAGIAVSHTLWRRHVAGPRHRLRPRPAESTPR